MTAELAAVVADAYAAFERPPPRGSLGVCTCPMCLSEADEKQLLTRDLRTLCGELLRQYTYAADRADITQMRDGLHYLLPRMLDLLAHGEELHFSDPSLALRQLAAIHFRNEWRPAEIEVVDGFYDAYLRSNVRAVLKDGAWAVEGDLENALVLATIGGADLQRLLDVIECITDPAAALHVATLRLWVKRDGKNTFTQAFLDYDPEVQKRIGHWLMSPEWTRRIAAIRPLAHADMLPTIVAALRR